MNIDPIIFFDLVITIFTLSLVLIVITIALSRLLKKSNEYHSELERLKGEIVKKNSLILDEKRNQAIRIIDNANNKALDIVHKANLFVSTSNETFNNQLKNITVNQLKAFEKATSDFIKMYGQVLNDLKSKNIEVFQNISENIEVDTLEEIKKFKQTIEQETIASEQELKKKIDQEYLLAKADVDQYREKKLKEIDDKIYEILEKVSKLVIGKALNISDQGELIIESLENAKKEGVFNSEK